MLGSRDILLRRGVGLLYHLLICFRGNAVTVKVECVGIALGTTIEVVGWNDTVGEVFAITGPLVGLFPDSSATCTMVIPTGNTTFMARVILVVE